jgi:hypothetical protein
LSVSYIKPPVFNFSCSYAILRAVGAFEAILKPKIEPAFIKTRLFVSRGDSAFIFMLFFLASKVVGVEKLSCLFIS